METVKAAIRRDRKTGRPILFFINHDDVRYWLECYDRVGQHSDCDRAYMQHCAPILHLDAECEALIREWRHLGGDEDVCDVKIVQRLMPPRNLRRA